MRRMMIAAAALAFGCGGPKSPAVRGVNTAEKAVETAGTATVESVKTVSGTTVGMVKGGTASAKREAESGAKKTKARTSAKAEETAKAAHGK